MTNATAHSKKDSHGWREFNRNSEENNKIKYLSKTEGVVEYEYI